jgi:hypothetical protein
MRLYQFINSQFALEAIGLRRLKISRLDRLNDPFEMLAGTQSDPAGRFAMRLIRDAIATHLGLLCFSRDWRNPVMWGHYAESHQGLCLGFDVDDRIAMPVQYVPKRLPFDHYLDPNTHEKEVRALAARLAFTKFSHWRYEKEVRCWVSLDPNGPDIQFHQLGKQIQLREVYIGFRSPITRQNVAAALGEELEDVVTVNNTRLAFRTFRVVRQRNRHLWR